VYVLTQHTLTHTHTLTVYFFFFLSCLVICSRSRSRGSLTGSWIALNSTNHTNNSAHLFSLLFAQQFFFFFWHSLSLSSVLCLSVFFSFLPLLLALFLSCSRCTLFWVLPLLLLPTIIPHPQSTHTGLIDFQDGAQSQIPSTLKATIQTVISHPPISSLLGWSIGNGKFLSFS